MHYLDQNFNKFKAILKHADNLQIATNQIHAVT